MGLPSKRRTSRSKRERAAHAALDKVSLGRCQNCQAPTLPHRACPACGMYRGRKVISAAKRTERAMRRAKKMR